MVDFVNLVEMPYEPTALAHWIFPDLTDRVSGAKLGRAMLLTVSAGGTGYPASSNVALVFAGGAGSGAAGIAVTDGSGVVTSAHMTNHGDYTVAPTATVSTGGGGSGAAITVGLGLAPTLSSNFLSTAAGQINALLSPYDDATTMTRCAVVKKTSAVAGFIFDTLNTGATAGSGLFANSANYQTSGALGLGTANPPAEAAVGDWLFVALQSKAGVSQTVCWGNGATYTSVGVPVLRTPTPKLGIGRRYFADGGGGAYQMAVDFAELILIADAPSPAELGAVYRRSKTRLATFGITVY